MDMNSFYREQARREQGAADGADLANVRDRCQRAADAWSRLADRLDHAARLRAAAKTTELTDALLREADLAPSR